MDTLLTPSAPHSDDESSRFIDQVLSQAASLRAQRQATDAEIAHLVAETRIVRDASVPLFAEPRQAVRDMAAALDRLAAHE